MGLFTRKSESDLYKEKEALEEKIREKSSVASGIAKRRQLEATIQQRKDALNKLKKIERSDSAWGRIRQKTSPVLRGIEDRVKRNAPAVMERISRVSKNVNQSMSGKQQSGFQMGWGTPQQGKKKGKHPFL